jgi:hypothetical protein
MNNIVLLKMLHAYDDDDTFFERTASGGSRLDDEVHSHFLIHYFRLGGIKLIDVILSTVRRDELCVALNR